MSLSVVLGACQPVNNSTQDQLEQEINHISSNNQQMDGQNQDRHERNDFQQENTGTHSANKKLLADLQHHTRLGLMYEAGGISLGTPVQTVLAKWGTPESGDPGYLNYKNSRHVGIRSDDTQTVSGIVSHHPDLQKLSIEDVTSVFGESRLRDERNLGSNILFYHAGRYGLYFKYQGNRIVEVSLYQR